MEYLDRLGFRSLFVILNDPINALALILQSTLHAQRDIDKDSDPDRGHHSEFISDDIDGMRSSSDFSIPEACGKGNVAF